MAKERNIFESTVEIHPKGHTQAEGGQGTASSSDSTEVDNTVLVADDTTDGPLSAPHHESGLPLDLSRLAVISAERREGVSASGNEYPAKARRGSTNSADDSSWITIVNQFLSIQRKKILNKSWNIY